jgi:hypothetical protein
LQQDRRYVSIFREWLEVTRNVSVFLLRYDSEPLDAENQLFLAAAELSAAVA